MEILHDVANYIIEQFIGTPKEFPEDECLEEAKHIIAIVSGEIFQDIEKSSHPMNTNMRGISLSRSEWEAIKKKYILV